jgi:hypothetical protein
MHSMPEKARAAQAITEGIGDASLGLQLLTILKLQDAVIWTPSQIFEESEEGASSRKRSRPFAFCLRKWRVQKRAGSLYNPGDFILTE